MGEETVVDRLHRLRAALTMGQKMTVTKTEQEKVEQSRLWSGAKRTGSATVELSPEEYIASQTRAPLFDCTSPHGRRSSASGGAAARRAGRETVDLSAAFARSSAHAPHPPSPVPHQHAEPSTSTPSSPSHQHGGVGMLARSSAQQWSDMGGGTSRPGAAGVSMGAGPGTHAHGASSWLDAGVISIGQVPLPPYMGLASPSSRPQSGPLQQGPELHVGGDDLGDEDEEDQGVDYGGELVSPIQRLRLQRHGAGNSGGGSPHRQHQRSSAPQRSAFVFEALEAARSSGGGAPGSSSNRPHSGSLNSPSVQQQLLQGAGRGLDPATASASGDLSQFLAVRRTSLAGRMARESSGVLGELPGPPRPPSSGSRLQGSELGSPQPFRRPHLRHGSEACASPRPPETPSEPTQPGTGAAVRALPSRSAPNELVLNPEGSSEEPAHAALPAAADARGRPFAAAVWQQPQLDTDLYQTVGAPEHSASAGGDCDDGRGSAESSGTREAWGAGASTPPPRHSPSDRDYERDSSASAVSSVPTPQAQRHLLQLLALQQEGSDSDRQARSSWSGGSPRSPASARSVRSSFNAASSASASSCRAVSLQRQANAAARVHAQQMQVQQQAAHRSLSTVSSPRPCSSGGGSAAAAAGAAASSSILDASASSVSPSSIPSLSDDMPKTCLLGVQSHIDPKDMPPVMYTGPSSYKFEYREYSRTGKSGFKARVLPGAHHQVHESQLARNADGTYRIVKPGNSTTRL